MAGSHRPSSILCQVTSTSSSPKPLGNRLYPTPTMFPDLFTMQAPTYMIKLDDSINGYKSTCLLGSLLLSADTKATAIKYASSCRTSSQALGPTFLLSSAPCVEPSGADSLLSSAPCVEPSGADSLLSSAPCVEPSGADSLLSSAPCVEPSGADPSLSIIDTRNLALGRMSYCFLSHHF